MADSLLTALSGLNAQQRAMEVTSHNIANAATPGYSRQRAEVQAVTPENIRPGQLGRGAQITAIRRTVDDLLSDRMRAAAGEYGRLDQLSSGLKNLELTFNEPGDAGLSKSIGDMFATFEDLANNAESGALRTTAAQSVDTWTANLRSLAQRIDSLKEDLRTAMDGEVRDINGITSEIAALNQSIRAQVNIGNHPNDLQDRRDALVQDLAERMAINVRRQSDGSAHIDVDGVSIIGTDAAVALQSDVDSNGGLVLRLPNGSALRPAGGHVAGLIEIQSTVISGVRSDLDTIATTVAVQLNRLYATATSHAMNAPNHLGSIAVPFSLAGTDLDDPALEPASSGSDGIPQAYRAVFSDASGTLIARNLTINLLDTASGIATKHTVRWDPTVGSGRSLQDLVSAINTGRGGGFSVFPPTAGIAGLSAQAVAVNGAFRLSLIARPGASIDFSPALDVQPTATAWTGPAFTASAAGNDPSYAEQRIGLRASSASQVQIFTRDPVNGTETIHGTVTLATGGAVAVGGITVTLPPTAGALRSGDATAIDVNALGTPTASTAVSNGWLASDATLTIKGRYTGSLSFDQSKPWSMRVITAGVIGAKIGTAIPNNPPLVEFSSWSGVPGAELQQKIQVTLDDSKPAGTPLQIGDGVYASLSPGSLSVAGASVAFHPDNQPDQAGILPALGINGLISGTSALTMDLSESVQAHPDRFSVGATRAEGDNSRVQNLLATRTAKAFGGGAFTLDDFYQGMLTGVGARVQQADRGLESQSVLRESLDGRRASVSGVNIDEEVGNLILQQQAYAASARMITTARENIQTLLDILR